MSTGSILDKFLSKLKDGFNSLQQSNSTVVINDNVISGSFSGNSVVIRNGKVIVDGKDVTPDGKVINVTITGNVYNLDINACSSLTINGDVGEIKSGSGDIKCKDVFGGIETGSGDVECSNVTGNIQTGAGNVDVNGNITGKVKTGAGNIKYRK